MRNFYYSIFPINQVLGVNANPQFLTNENSFWTKVFSSKTPMHSLFKPLLSFYYLHKSYQYLKHHSSDLTVVYICQLGISFACADKIFQLIHKKKSNWILRIGSDIDSPIYFPRIFSKCWIKLSRFFFKLMIQQAPYVITVDPDLTSKISRHYQKPPHLMQTIPNCCPIFRNVYQAKTNFDSLSNRPYYLAFGRLHYQKGFDFLIVVFSQWLKKNPNEQLIIIGEGPQRKKLEHLIASLNLQKNVFLTGFLPNPEFLATGANACIVPSRSEGFCKVVVEIMMHGGIVLASDCNFGPKSIIENHVSGLLFKNESNPSLLNMLNHIQLMTSEDRSKMQTAAKNRANTYSPDTIGQKFQEYIDNITQFYIHSTRQVTPTTSSELK